MSMTDLTQHWRSLYDNNYLGAWNLWDAQKKTYRTVTVTVERMVRESVTMQGGRKEMANLLYFRGKRTPLIVTKKMARVLVGMFGPSPADALGKTITLYVERGFRTKDGPADVLRIRNDKASASLKEQLREEAPMQAPEEFVEEGGSDNPDEGP
jgi:hypothetical protein